MALTINTNTTAALSAINVSKNHALLQKSLTALSTGFKVNSPADDAGGLAVAMKLNAAIRRNAAVQNNLNNAISFLQTQDGALATIGTIVDRISELKMLHSDITKSSSDKANYNTEYTQLLGQLNNLKAEQFNSVTLFGRAPGTVQITENGSQSVTMSTCTLASVMAKISKASLGAVVIGDITGALQLLATARAVNGAQTNRLQFALDMLTVNKANLEAACGRIMDADIATESTKFAKLQILAQGNSTMLSQANMLPQAALQLMRF